MMSQKQRYNMDQTERKSYGICQLRKTFPRKYDYEEIRMDLWIQLEIERQQIIKH